MTVLEIIQCGPHASVQDAGRAGYRRYGVSTAGAMDLQSLALANALVGNRWDAAAIELPLSGAAFQIIGGPVLVAVSGAGVALEISGRPVSDHTSAHAVDGDRITVGSPRDGVFGYISIAGGIANKPDLGSRSFHRRTGLGGPALAARDRLPCEYCTDAHPPLRYLGPDLSPPDPIRVVPGPQFDHFSETARDRFLSETFRISPRSDRMGIRLDGPPLLSTKGHDILSEGVVPGSIQVPGDRQPIVLGRDCQTTGGYPKIATVISADFDRLAQCKVSQTLRFQAVTMEEALEAARRVDDWRRSLQRHLRPAGVVPLDLHAHNLIGGVTRGDD